MKTHLAALTLALAMLCAGGTATAYPLYVLFNFQGAATDPVNAGVTGSGWFSFNSNVMPDSAYWASYEAFRPSYDPSARLYLRWDGMLWTEENAVLDEGLFFDAFQNEMWLGWWAWRAPGFYVRGKDETPERKYLSGTLTYPSRSGSATYTVPISWRMTDQAPPVPEPETISLLGFGILALGLDRLRGR